MLIKSRKDLSFVSRGPVGLPRGRNALAGSNFTNLFMRPNSSDGGTIPASSPYSSSPDIWIAGLDPIANYQTALATTQSYATESSNNVYEGQGNFIYARGMNGATIDEQATVKMYYSPSAVVQSPSQWQNNVVMTDSGQSQGQIASTAPNAIGVCSSTFVWSDPPPPPPGSDHYCLFVQFNDANNTNPFPNVETVFDMGSLIMNNLRWGWRNVSMIPGAPTWQLSEPVTIPSNYPTQTYTILVTPTGWVGWDVDFHCSQTDSNGNPITLKRTTIQQDGVVLGVNNAVLDGGWNGQMFVNLYSPNGQPAPAGASIPLSCNYVAKSPLELLEAAERGLIDWDHTYRMRKYCPEIAIGPTAWIPQGAYSGTVSNNPSVAAWWRRRGYKV